MSEWIRWWENKFFLCGLGVALLSMLLSFLLAYFIYWGWIPAIVVATCGGMLIRRIAVMGIDDYVKRKRNR